MQNAVITTKDKKQYSISSDYAPGGTYEWNEKNGFLQKIPLMIQFVDSWGKKQTLSENWPQVLLDIYAELELVGMEDGGPSVVQPKRKPGRPRKTKEKNHSATSGRWSLMRAQVSPRGTNVERQTSVRV